MNRYITLTLCVLTAFLFTLLLHYFLGGNPWNRIGYALFVSVLPALLSLVAIKLFRLATAKIIGMYILWFLIVVILQSVLRMISDAE